jgi:hypothetical protein
MPHLLFDTKKLKSTPFKPSSLDAKKPAIG